MVRLHTYRCPAPRPTGILSIRRSRDIESYLSTVLNQPTNQTCHSEQYSTHFEELELTIYFQFVNEFVFLLMLLITRWEFSPPHCIAILRVHDFLRLKCVTVFTSCATDNMCSEFDESSSFGSGGCGSSDVDSSPTVPQRLERRFTRSQRRLLELEEEERRRRSCAAQLDSGTCSLSG